jgi:hypothetical protein
MSMFERLTFRPCSDGSAVCLGLPEVVKVRVVSFGFSFRNGLASVITVQDVTEVRVYSVLLINQQASKY